MRLESIVLLAIPLQKCRPLRSRHLFRGRAERRDSGLRCTPATDSPSERCRFATVNVGPRRYGRLLVCVAATPVSAELQEPFGLLALAGCNRLRLHSDKEPSSAGPTARWKPCGIVLLRCHRASAGVTVVSPLEGFPVRRLPRLSACRLDFSGHPASRLKPSRRMSVKARAIG